MVRMGARQAVQCNAGAGAARFVAQNIFRVTDWWACASKKWLADCGSTVPACARCCEECMAGVTARTAIRVQSARSDTLASLTAVTMMYSNSTV